MTSCKCNRFVSVRIMKVFFLLDEMIFFTKDTYFDRDVLSWIVNNNSGLPPRLRCMCIHIINGKQMYSGVL